MKLATSELKENLLKIVETVKVKTGVEPVSIRKALPEFRGHINRMHTAYYQFNSLAQQIEVVKVLRELKTVKA